MGIHRILVGQVLVLNVAKFCEEMCQAVEKWSQDIERNDVITKKINQLLTIKKEGLNPIPGVRIGG